MLTQLTRLSVAADGRYAVAEELQFLKDYFQSLDQRVSAYEKIRAAEEQIISQAEAKMRNLESNVFRTSAEDYAEKCRRDMVRLLRYTTAALLFNDYEHLRQGILLWHNTIAKSYQFDQTSKMTSKVMPEVVKQYLTAQEAALFCRIWELNCIIVG